MAKRRDRTTKIAKNLEKQTGQTLGVNIDFTRDKLNKKQSFLRIKGRRGVRARARMARERAIRETENQPSGGDSTNSPKT